MLTMENVLDTIFPTEHQLRIMLTTYPHLVYFHVDVFTVYNAVHEVLLFTNVEMYILLEATFLQATFNITWRSLMQEQLCYIEYQIEIGVNYKAKLEDILIY